MSNECIWLHDVVVRASHSQS